MKAAVKLTKSQRWLLEHVRAGWQLGCVAGTHGQNESWFTRTDDRQGIQAVTITARALASRNLIERFDKDHWWLNQAGLAELRKP